MIVDLEGGGRPYRLEIDKSTHMGKLIAEGHPYERALLERVRELGLQGLAVDIGAHVGNHSLWFAEVCGLSVVAFEPDPELAAMLRRNVTLNGSDIRVEQVALGAKKGRACGLARHLGLAEGCPIYPLDHYCLKDVALLKIDVEGMEAAVLAGARDTVRRCQPSIFTECWSPPFTEAVAAQIEPLGYRMVETITTATPVVRWEPA